MMQRKTRAVRKKEAHEHADAIIAQIEARWPGLRVYRGILAGGKIPIRLRVGVANVYLPPLFVDEQTGGLYVPHEYGVPPDEITTEWLLARISRFIETLILAVDGLR